MSQTTERVSSVRELLTPFTTVMVCNDVMGLLPVRVQQQGVDTTTVYYNGRAHSGSSASAACWNIRDWLTIRLARTVML